MNHIETSLLSRRDLNRLGLRQIQTPWEYAEKWVGNLSENVHELLERRGDKFDRAKALRGLIVGNISGDVVNPLWAALAYCEKAITRNQQLDIFSQWMVNAGVGSSWLAATGAIKEFGCYVPQPTLDAYETIFQTYEGFARDILDCYPMSVRDISKEGKGFFDAIHNSFTAPGLEPDDRSYYLNIYEPKRYPFP